jgi:predicted membrane GTPase involved in stress response
MLPTIRSAGKRDHLNWDLPRGLAAALDDNDEIVEVTPDHIKILKCRRDILHFVRNVS